MIIKSTANHNQIIPHLISKSKSIEKKIGLFVEGGYFSKEDLKKEAFKTLLRERSDLRIALAVEEYKRGEITLNRAAEVAVVTAEEMKKSWSIEEFH